LRISPESALGEQRDLAADRTDVLRQAEEILRYQVSENPRFPVPIPL
jgi:hypothetical protein